MKGNGALVEVIVLAASTWVGFVHQTSMEFFRVEFENEIAFVAPKLFYYVRDLGICSQVDEVGVDGGVHYATLELAFAPLLGRDDLIEVLRDVVGLNHLLL